MSRGGLSLVQAVRGWFDDEVAVVPEESVYPPDRSEEETRQANREAFLTSEQAAESAALGHLGLPGQGRRPGGPEGLAVGVAARRGRRHRRGRRPADARPRHAAAVLTAIPGGTTVTVDSTRLGTPGRSPRSPPKAAEDRDGLAAGRAAS